eukprot:3242811-Prymnesium_polylepis.1
MLLMLGLATAVLLWLDRVGGSPSAAATLDCGLTLLFALLLTFSFGAIADTFALFGTVHPTKLTVKLRGEHDYVFVYETWVPESLPPPLASVLGAAFASALLVLQLLLLARFYAS